MQLHHHYIILLENGRRLLFAFPLTPARSLLSEGNGLHAALNPEQTMSYHTITIVKQSLDAVRKHSSLLNPTHRHTEKRYTQTHNNFA